MATGFLLEHLNQRTRGREDGCPLHQQPPAIRQGDFRLRGPAGRESLPAAEQSADRLLPRDRLSATSPCHRTEFGPAGGVLEPHLAPGAVNERDDGGTRLDQL
jgi:hypothetical protein